MALCGLSSGALATASFPNSHLLLPTAIGGAAPSPAWAPAESQSALAALRRAVTDEDWAGNYSEGLTKIHMRAEWSASLERCSLLQTLASAPGVCRVMEIGSFCGVGALALAEALPGNGEVLALELDPFVVNFGRRFQQRSPSGHKIRHMQGAALSSLRQLAQQVQMGQCKPFDLVVVDADKENMGQYFQLLWDTPGLLSDDALVCVDLTPFKGQPPLRYVKYGFPYRYEADSGQKQIDALRAHVAASTAFSSYEFCGLLAVQRARAL